MLLVYYKPQIKINGDKSNLIPNVIRLMVFGGGLDWLYFNGSNVPMLRLPYLMLYTMFCFLYFTSYVPISKHYPSDYETISTVTNVCA